MTRHEHFEMSSAKDAHNFQVGMKLEYRGTRRQRARVFWHRLTRWFRPRTVVSAVDHSAGRIVLSREVWSWRRWRWERR